MISGEKKKRARSVCCFNIYKMIRQIILCTSATREQTRAKNIEKVMKSRERIGQGGFFFEKFPSCHDDVCRYSNTYCLLVSNNIGYTKRSKSVHTSMCSTGVGSNIKHTTK
jgi:hypothetical protein